MTIPAAPYRPATRVVSRSHGPLPFWFFAATLAATCHPTAAPAQEYGQWSWNASLGAASRGVTSSIDDVTSEDWRVDDLRVFVGVNGFVVHPAIAAFELGGDFSVQSETSGFNQDRSGYLGRVRILPQSAVPIEIHASRTSYDYGAESPGDPLFLRGAPDSITSVGGLLRVRRGLLAGMQAGFERTATDFLETVPRDGDNWEHAFANWSGESAGIKHLVLFDRRLTEYGNLGYTYDDLSMTIDERGEIGEHWDWNAVGSGFVRDYDYEAGPSGSTTLLRLRSHASRTYASSGLLTLRYDAGSTSADDAETTWTQQLFADLRLPIGSSWTISPYAGVNYAATDHVSATIPQVGVAGSWNGSARDAIIDVNGSLGVLSLDETIEENRETFDVEGTELAGSLGIMVAKTGEHGLSQRLDLAAARNEFSSAGEAITSLPNLGFGAAPSGFQDSGRVRLSLSKNLDARRLSMWAEYGVRRFEEEARQPASTDNTGTISDLLVSLQWNSSRAQLLFNGGSTEIDGTGGPQNIDFYAGSIAVRATRSLSLTVSWLHSNQDVELAPDITLDRLDARAEFAAGLLRLGARAYFTREERMDALAFDSTGLEFYLRRDFGGLLPIVSAPGRRGVVK